jgi:hypothetical protein
VFSNGVAEEPISSELVLVDEELGRRARAALPDPPWLLPALAELRERPPAERVAAPVAAPVPARPARPPVRRRRPAASSVVLVVIALAFAGVTALAFVPQSRGPSFGTTPVEQAAPAVPVRPPAVTRTKPPTKPKPKSTPPQRAAKPRKAPRRERPAAKTRPKRHAAKPKPKPAPTPRGLSNAQRVITWRRNPAAVYYVVYLQRGTKTIFATSSRRRRTVLPVRLALRPGTYHVVVRPAVPSDAGIILAPPILTKTMKV